MNALFDLSQQVVLITGGGGLLGRQHALAVAKHGATPVILDLKQTVADEAAHAVEKACPVKCLSLSMDVTSEASIVRAKETILKELGHVDVLVNNAANNPAVTQSHSLTNATRLEAFDVALWDKDLAVGLTGAFLCAKHFGTVMTQNPQGGSIINVSSDLGLISPDQRLYRKPGLAEAEQSVKPVTYSVIKTGLIGLTRYLATYWAEQKVRCNAICPGGVWNHQNEDFVKRVSQLIPMGRMAKEDEYQGIIVFLASQASSYMTGAVLAIDGGRTCW